MESILHDETTAQRDIRLANEKKAIPRLQDFYSDGNKKLKRWLENENHRRLHYLSYHYDSLHTMKYAREFFEMSTRYKELYDHYFKTIHKEVEPVSRERMDVLRKSYHEPPTLVRWMDGTGQTPRFKAYYTPKDGEWRLFMQMYYYLDQTMNDYWADHEEDAFTGKYSEDRISTFEGKRFVVFRHEIGVEGRRGYEEGHPDPRKAIKPPKYWLYRRFENDKESFCCKEANRVKNRRQWVPDPGNHNQTTFADYKHPKKTYREILFGDGRNEIIDGYEIDGKKKWTYDVDQAAENKRFRTEQNAAEALQRMRIFYTKTVLET